METKIKNVLVVGAGMMGHSTAQVLAAYGFKTVLADLSQDKLDEALKQIQLNIEGLKKEGLADDNYEKAVKENLSTILTKDIPTIAKEIDFVSEVIYENAQAKHDLFKMLSDHCREDCILSSDTSSMDVFSVTDDCMKNKNRMIIVHWFNPPHIMKLVEVVRGPETSDETLQEVMNMLRVCEKKPIVLNKFVNGFIVNRLGVAMVREMLYMVEQGLASPQDLNTALKYSDGLRWSFEGPFDLCDYIGLGLVDAAHNIISPSLCNDPEIHYWKKLITEGKTGIKSGEGIMGTYPKDPEEYTEKRNKRIIEMCKVMDRFEKEDSAD